MPRELSNSESAIRSKDWRRRNPHKVKEDNRKYREANRDFVNAASLRNYHRARAQGDTRVKIKNFKACAKRRNLQWQLTDEHAKRLCLSDCLYCGLKPNPFMGIDRKDSSVRAYRPDNVVACCRNCNRSKNVHGFEEWMARCERQKMIQHDTK
jgi:5-methylcytosine-specific restriction endonuclease McrA